MKNHIQFSNMLFYFSWGILVPLILNFSLAISGEPVSKEKNQRSFENENYWTPERLKEAKPLELPHPTDPPPTVPSTPPPPSHPPSVEAPGSPGDGDTGPADKNLLMEENQNSKSY